MPYLMGGFPDVADVAPDRRGLHRRRRRPDRARRPVLRPARRRPRHPRRGDQGAARRRDGRRRPDRLRRALPAGPGHHDDVHQPRPRARRRRPSPTKLAAAGAAGLIVPDLPLEESDEVLAACDAAGLALVPLVAPTTPDERMARIGARARGFVYTVSVIGTTGERAALSDTFGSLVARAKAAHRRPGRARLRHRQRPSRPCRPPRPAPTASSSAAASSAPPPRPTTRPPPCATLVEGFSAALAAA